MKTVFSTNDMVAHIWGQQTQDHGRSPTPTGGGQFASGLGATESRVSFKGRVFYSYREPVARLVENAKGTLSLIATSKTWSPSTSGHVASAIGSARHLIGGDESTPGRLYRVPHIGGYWYGSPGCWEGDAPVAVEHTRNAQFLATQYRDAVAHYEGRAKIRCDWIPGVDWSATIDNPESRCYSEGATVYNRLAALFAAASDYCDDFLADAGDDRFAVLGPDFPLSFDAVKSTAARIMAEREARAARALAKLTPAELARRAARKAATAEKAERARALRFASAAEKLEGWRDGLRINHWSLPSQDANGGALVRATGVKRDKAGMITGGALETSQGATVPLVHAVKVFRFLKLCRDKGTAWQSNGRTIRVGHFNVNRIDPTGDFVAGCHRINWPEVEALALRLGVFALPASDDALVPSQAAA